MTEIPLSSVFVCLAPVIVVAIISTRWAARGREIGVSTVRMLIQLLAAGYFLAAIFTAQNVFMVLGVLVVMIVVSAMISIRTITENRRRSFFCAMAGIGLGGGVSLLFVLYGVLDLDDPMHQPRVAIPLAGMVFSNAMTAVTLAADRFEREVTLGAAYLDARKMAWTAALIPQVNALMAVGLVSLPGMMTGQILAGVDPLIAVRYQIIVMSMVLQSAAFSVALFLWMRRPPPDEAIVAAADL